MRGHRRPAQPPTANWQPLVDSYLSSYAGGVSRSDVDYAEAWAANASQFTAAGSWRARVVNGSLWVRPIHFYEHWKERASMQPRFERAAAAWGWEQRDARAYFGGACSTGISRQSLLPLNRTHGELLHVLDVGFGRSGARWGNFSAQLPPDYACRFQVLLSVPGFGYSNRLRQLLACGSAVVHVQHQSHEFFEPLLKSGEHSGR
ncbi:hypothetical protein EMIHUDRAFT_249850 [Emiliania huxleyi CCMP1516]|uniref:Glycosyl transferase CAP10 domain-containing protein n=2 Tax=Emiliania huxleyi TaxID=2903 RepID=A0A0D3I5F1_EMIH1|nr:hypothetical protein EMIHUDRAFT_249850 [Emiliania huxleyi CCMP1516]EOD06486.1 hypothetical protein EMIHUDRAFT_249850 [Emiliania huxleyi CCMP1516]|eukprot:XP_005758915.1 hypothetical protein EMIHUDRAFT_249850 [Emiliania huxleyi CCMP1516]